MGVKEQAKEQIIDFGKLIDLLKVVRNWIQEDLLSGTHLFTHIIEYLEKVKENDDKVRKINEALTDFDKTNIIDNVREIWWVEIATRMIFFLDKLGLYFEFANSLPKHLREILNPIFIHRNQLLKKQEDLDKKIVKKEKKQL